MTWTRMSPLKERGRQFRTTAAALDLNRSTLPPYQTRTCARCGRTTTFVLEDAAGGWYACIECGRYA